jgi:hypothetical protein
MVKLRARVNDEEWSFSPNFVCNTSLYYALVRTESWAT